MIFKNYLLFILKKQFLIKFNYLNIFTNLYIQNLLILSPYYLYKFKIKLNLVLLYKIFLYLFNQRIFLLDIKFRNIFKTKYILLNYILNLKKNNLYNFIDYFFIFLLFNYNYFLKRKNYIVLYNNKLMFRNHNFQNFFLKFYKYDVFVLYTFFLSLNIKCLKRYNSFYFSNLLLF